MFGDVLGIPELEQAQFDSHGIFVTCPLDSEATADAPRSTMAEMAEHPKTNDSSQKKPASGILAAPPRF